MRMRFAFVVGGMLLATPALAFKGWDQDACMKEGNTAEVCTCTEAHVMEKLASLFPPEVVAAFDKDGMPGVVPLLSPEEQMKFGFEGIARAMEEAAEVCKYHDDPKI